MKDAKNFDTRAWIVAVGIVFTAFVILSLGICIVLYKEWQEAEDVPGMERQKAFAFNFVACLLLLDPFFLLLILLLWFAVPLCFCFTHQFTNNTLGGRERKKDRGREE